ncbi:hypothetical protein D8S78_20700 [Natrialba swarupiae]|nr:hypothetical protein [Natrialba swarupiae]
MEQIADEISYPALVRPRRSAGSRGITRVESDRELKSAFLEVKEEYGIPMIQEYVEKRGIQLPVFFWTENRMRLHPFVRTDQGVST